RQTAAAAPVLGRIPAAWRNAAGRPRQRVYRRGPEQYAVTYASVGRRLVSDFVDGVDVLDVLGDRVVLGDGPIRETYRVTVTGGSVDVDGPHGSAGFEPVPTFTDPAESVAQGSLLAPMPATITTVAVEVGAVVAKGDPIVVLEAMKMQHTVTAPTDGTVTGLTAVVGRQVVAGAVLAVIEEKP
ncbi:biotin/lipoyl-containing protein, partial [Actinoplanes sp. NPDC026670]|uniref:acetyl-CoA carboxylase biotin carboxyl carrier protein subunit n=1 Tax=Actinoplanes sp. NPDC026670 TaxID=3154700 RepID=UPI0033F07113